ncbi:MAG: polysaccharide deacetylase family protein, partial [Actinobacteria bacterium]|nr:polysaccharide deacetylase family protein [Actinomycetota bacterium]
MADEQSQGSEPPQAHGDGDAVPNPGDRTGPPVRLHRARVWQLLVVGGLFAAGVVLWQGANTHTGGWFGHQISHGPRHTNQVALTFDDGPNSTATVPILDLLDARGVKGTFFVVGRAVAARPDLARMIVERGHLVGNHSWRHDSKAWLDPRYP